MQKHETSKANEPGEPLIDEHVSKIMHMERNWKGTVKRSVILKRGKGPVNKLW